MNDIAIRVENLSKLYHIGRAQEQHDTLRDALVAGLRAPLQRLSQITNHKSRITNHDDTIWALKDVSFEVKRGEVIGIIGRNGAGKSTLLKILSRITEPTKGRAEIHGRVGSLLEVGTGFHPELTGRENVYLSGAILGMRRHEIERKFDEIVDFSGVEKFIDTPIKRYSSGMKVRLGFAVAAHLDPEILLIDEVLAVGDAQFQKKCLGKMGDVAHQGRTVLFVSHNLIALQSLCPRAIWLNDGRLIEDGLSLDVVASYLDLQTTKLREQVWDDPVVAPGTEIARLHRVWVEPEDASLGVDVITRETPVSIGVEYWHFDPDVQIHITLQVSVEQQVVAFASASSQDPFWEEVARRRGLMRCTCQIPAQLLNTGQHRIRVLVVRDRSRVIYAMEDALSFEVVELEQRGSAWFGKVAGVVRPALRWQSEYLGALEDACMPNGQNCI